MRRLTRAALFLGLTGCGGGTDPPPRPLSLTAGQADAIKKQDEADEDDDQEPPRSDARPPAR